MTVSHYRRVSNLKRINHQPSTNAGGALGLHSAISCEGRGVPGHGIGRTHAPVVAGWSSFDDLITDEQPWTGGLIDIFLLPNGWLVDVRRFFRGVEYQLLGCIRTTHGGMTCSQCRLVQPRSMTLQNPASQDLLEQNWCGFSKVGNGSKSLVIDSYW